MPARIPDNILLQDLRDFYEETGSINRFEYNSKLDAFCSETQIRRFGSWGTALEKAGVPHNLNQCPECGRFYEQLSQHWRNNPNHYPEISQRQKEILTGFLMGDGCVSRKDKDGTPYFQTNMIIPEFLEWLDEEMGVVGLGVKSYKEGSYYWSTRTHPNFEVFRDWYGEEGKKYPDDIKLTPLILKVWYCGDGNFSKARTENSSPSLRISCCNEYDNPEKIEEMFERLGVVPKIYRGINHRGNEVMSFSFDVDDSEWLWSWMGEPLPGFKYKWPSDDDNTGRNEIFWTDEEIDILVEEYPEKGTDIKSINRPSSSIKSKASRMGIRYYD